MKSNKGIALITVLVIIVIIGALITSLSINMSNNLSLSANYKNSITNFYECEGINNIEDLNVVTIAVSDISKPSTIRSGSSTIPGTNDSYSVTIKYNFYKPTMIPGTSLNTFNDYFYIVSTTKGRITIRKLISKVGPKM